jgi:hypothetical protein
MLNAEIQEVYKIARMIAKEEIALALKSLEAAQAKPEAANEKKEVKKNA